MRGTVILLKRTLSLLIIAAARCSVFGQICPDDPTKLAPSGLKHDNQGGAATVIDVNLLVIGTNDGETIYFYQRAGTSWRYVGDFSPLAEATHAYFGSSLALGSNLLIVGAGGDTNNGIRSGSFYVVAEVDGVWQQVQKIISPSDQFLNGFGGSLSISADRIATSAAGDNDTAQAAGAAYIYLRGSDGVWSLEQKIQADDAAFAQFFGNSVAIDGDWLAVGDDEGEGDVNLSGAVYLFHRDDALGWVQTDKLLPAQLTEQAYWGWGLAMQGDLLVSGAPGMYGFTGAAYVYRLQLDDSWTQEAELLPGDPALFSSFGLSVALDNGLVAIGAPNSEGRPGATYIYQQDQNGVWGQQAKLEPDPDHIETFAGWSVAISGATVVMGAYQDDTIAQDAGAAFVYELACSPGCTGDLNADGTVNLTDLATQLAHYGETSAPPQDGDLNGDGDIDLTDLAGLLAVYGSICP